MTAIEGEQPQVEEKQEDNTIATIPETVERHLHQLKNKWTFWYLNDQRSMTWEERLKDICTFSTVEEFWA